MRIKKINNIEERCECGRSIPRGYGYYNLGKGVKCFGCGRVNFRSHIETPKEFEDKIKEALK